MELKWIFLIIGNIMLIPPIIWFAIKKSPPSASGYNYPDMENVFGAMMFIILYLLFWIFWLIIY